MVTERAGEIDVYFVDEEGPLLGREQDALDLIGQIYGKEIDVIAVPSIRFNPQFFQLSSKLASNFFQKMQNYQVRLIVIGDISDHTENSIALRDFVRETNRIGHHIFAADRPEMAAKLCRRA